MVGVSTAHAQRRVASCARRAASLPHRRLAHKRRLPAPAAAACTPPPPRGAPSTAATAGGAAATHATVNSPQPALGLTLSLGLTVACSCAAGSACACRVGVALLQQHAGFLQDVCCHATIVGSERCLAGRCSRPGSRTRAVWCCAATAGARTEGGGDEPTKPATPVQPAARRTSQWPGQPRRPSARRWQQPAASVVAACAAAPTSAAAPSRSSR